MPIYKRIEAFLAFLVTVIGVLVTGILVIGVLVLIKFFYTFKKALCFWLLASTTSTFSCSKALALEHIL